uniref:carbonic anhydrase n=1 Tax=Attheya septentrionalis TaxID=420275 RepID=A0A7S2UQH9_9STRA|mmetsp:Transcript_8270/g.14978  ORF Transcript_8270/g.14978 Transcript_8270/m.14978 type:complete len:539 (+) Transcript_8270:122-1738(+)
MRLVTIGSQMLLVGVLALSALVPFVEGRGLAPVEPEEITLQVNASASEGDGIYNMPPTLSPIVSISPSDVPTASSVPSTGSTADPSITPSLAPSSKPSSAPLDTASSLPTSAPTVDPYPENPAPSNTPQSYFNYDTSPNAKYGPGSTKVNKTLDSSTEVFYYEENTWQNVPYDTKDDYWAEFGNEGFGAWKGVLESRLHKGNQCDENRRQSPIDARDSGHPCEKSHQIRTNPGDFEINDDVNIEKQILPNKLRMKFARRLCPACPEPDPPMADFPRYSYGFSDLLHIDIKIPSEHTIEGKRYAAEYQMFHLHYRREMSGSIGIMIDFNETSPHNEALALAINRFWVTFNSNAAECGRMLQKDRNLVSRVRGMLGLEMKDDNIDYESWDKFSTLMDAPESTVGRKNRLGGKGKNENHRDLQEHIDVGKATNDRARNPNAWDPYDRDWLVKSVWFWHYIGSLTEPPCSIMNDWFVLDKPMIISKSQMEELKQLLFLNVDGNCERTSVHHEQSVARPIQPTGDIEVRRCTRANYKDDLDPE